MNYALAIICSLLFTSFTLAQSTTTKDSLSTIVQRIATSNKYESQYVGIAGSYSQQYKNYVALLHLSTPQDLLLLVTHQNPAARIYAFKALVSKDKKLATSIYNILKSDEATVFTLEGCIGGQATVSSLASRFMADAKASD